MTIYVEIKDGKVIASTPNIKIAENVFGSYITTDYEDYTPSNIKYVFDGEKIVLNPEYETELEKQEKAQRKSEIIEELNNLDLKTIRALRSNDTEYIEKYENEAKALREELNNL